MSRHTAASPQGLPLPKGGGSVRGLGDAFTPDLNRGTGSYAIEIDVPNGHANLKPQLVLAYNSSNGDGPFGYGWTLPLTRIQIDTDRGAASYLDPSYLLDGESLVRLADGGYRQRVENAFHRLRRDGDAWELTDRRGTVSRLGSSRASRIGGSVAGQERTFAWLVDEVRDPSGNEIRFDYRRDGDDLFVTRIDYAAFTVAFEYEPRHDATTNRRPGFPITRRLRCRAIEVRRPAAEHPLIRRYTLHYADDHEGPSLLERVVMTGFKRQPDGSVHQRDAPAVEMSYAPFDPTARRLRPIAQQTPVPPGPLGRQGRVLVDMDGDGLPDVVQMSEGRTRLWNNRGDGSFEPPRALDALPRPGRGGTMLLDIDGSGSLDVVDLQPRSMRYFPGRGDGRFGRARHVGRDGRPLGFAAADPDSAVADVDGDGRVDLIRTTARGLVVWRNLGGEAGFAQPTLSPRGSSRDALPDVRLSEPRTFVADMTGDGLPDIVHIASGVVEYWPNLGGGRYGGRETIARAPQLPRHVEPRRLFLADVDGTGPADVVYVGHHEVTIWRNLAGVRFADPVTVAGTPFAPADAIALTDLLGTGNAGVLWTDIRGARGSRYRYLSLTDTKPYLMTQVREGTGMVTRIDYDASPQHAARDRAQGRAWPTSLPVPVPVVRRIVNEDGVTGVADTTDIRYHDGHWDPATRRFRGFGRVTTHRRAGAEGDGSYEEHAFLVGAPGEPALAASSELAEADTVRARRGQVYRSSYYGAQPGALPLRVEETHWQVVRAGQGIEGTPILAPKVTATVVRNAEGGDHPRVTTAEYQYDAFGNVVRERRLGSAPDGDDDGRAVDPLVVVTETEYAINEERHLLDRVSRVVRRDDQDNVLAEVRHYYDGEDFEGLPLGRVETGLLRRQEEMVLSVERAAALYGAMEPDWEALGYHRSSQVDGREMLARHPARYAHTRHGMVERQRDALGRDTHYRYDTDGLLVVSSTNAEQHEQSATWDAGWQLIEESVSAAGARTRYTYDGLGRLASIVRPGDDDERPTVRYRYQDETLPRAIRTEQRRHSGEADVYERVEYYDASGNPIQERTRIDDERVHVSGAVELDRRGEPVRRGLDRYGTGLAFEPPAPLREGDGFGYRYDAIGRLVGADGPDGSRYDVRYTPWTATHRGNAPDSGDGGEATAPRTEHFDPFGRLVGVTRANGDGGGHRSDYTYDLLGRLIASTDAEGRPAFRHIDYDGSGNKLRIDHVATGLRTAVHDASGRLVRLWDERERVTSRRYDRLGRLAAVSMDGAEVERFHYDAEAQGAGRLAQVEDAAGTVTFEYDQRGRLATKVRTIGADSYTIGYDYDAAGLLRRLTYPDGASATFERWGDTRVRRVEGIVDEISYDAQGRLRAIDHANGVQETRGYADDAGRLTALAVRRGDRRLWDASLHYDEAGHLHRLGTTGDAGGDARTERYRHDALGFLVEAGVESGGESDQWSYRYDAAGNLLANGEAGVADYGYDFDRPGALTDYTPAGGAPRPLSFDAAGNLSELDGATLEYDAGGRLTRISRPDGTTVEMTYDYRGARVRKRVTGPEGTRETRYVDELYEDHAGTGTGYVMAAGRLLGYLRGGGRRHLHVDHRGSVVLVTHPNGSADARAWFGPYGAAAERSGDGPSRDYTGAVFDAETGLLYLNCRYFDPRLGRFLTPDPLFLGRPERFLERPVAHNLYLYAGADPVQYVDPTGLFLETVGKVLAGIVVVAAVATAAALVWVMVKAALPFMIAGAVIGAVAGGLATGSWEGAAIGAMMGATLGLNLAIAGPVVGTLLGIVHVMGISPSVRGQGWYKSLVGWSSWFAPASWPGHVLGLGVFLANGIAHVFGSSEQIESVHFDWRHGQIQTVGGEFGGGVFEVFPDWTGMTMGAPAHNVGAFSFFRDDNAFDTRTIEHETGHMLNNMIFGFWQVINSLQTGVLGMEHEDSLFERIAESNVNEVERRPWGNDFWA